MKDTIQFFFSWFGSKYKETKIIYPFLKLDNINTIVEPFCGSCGFSYYLFKNKELNNIKYHLNDFDKQLILFLNDIKSDGTKKYIDYYNINVEKYIKNKNDWQTLVKIHDNLNEYFIYSHLRGRGNMKDIRRNHINDDRFINVEKFIRMNDTILTNKDYTEILKKYHNKKNVLIFLDPPYFDSFNSMYMGMKGKTQIDNTQMYINILNFLKTCKCQCMMILNDCALFRYLFSEYIVHTYDKIYQSTKRHVKHIIIYKI